jgi:glutamate-1-semialdehyde 2,1-aminomutase
MTTRNRQLIQLASRFIPSGVNSPVRAFRAVGGAPIFVKRGKGAYIWDEAGKKYLDFCGSWGPLLFGHAPAGLIQTLRRELAKGTSFGAATVKEVELAKKIQSFFPSMEKVRLVSSGTEAVMTAIRLARGFTGRKKILKIEGGYHGHVDSLLVKAGSGGATFGIPDSAGIPEELARLTLTIPFNDFEALEKIFKKEGRNIAAFILEPVPANMGVALPKKGYLEQARALTKKYGVLLIFDEVITGFRVAPGGAQQYFGVKPDLTCLGKILGGGLPIAAFGGKAKIMNQLAPAGPVYQAGTLSGNPVAVTAALWMLDQLSASLRGARRATKQSREIASVASLPRNDGAVDLLNHRASNFYREWSHFIKSKNLPLQLNTIASMFTLFFSERPVSDYASARKSNTRAYARFFHTCLKQGIYLAPSQFEAHFISTEHTDSDLNRALEVFEKVLAV